MFLNHLTFGTYPRGHLSGVIGFTLDLSGEAADESELADLIIAIHRHEKGPYKNILVRGKFTTENTLDILTLIRSLRDAKYFIIVVTEGRHYLQWFKEANYLIAETRQAEWIGFIVNEIWFLYDKVEQDELILPPMERTPLLYLLPGEDITPVDIMRFLRKGKYQWSVSFVPRMEIIQVVNYIEETT